MIVSLLDIRRPGGISLFTITQPEHPGSYRERCKTDLNDES